MNKIGDWLNSIPLAGIVLTSFMVGSLYGKEFDGLNWETLAAGFMGLCGGAFALVSARWSNIQTEKKAAYTFCVQLSLSGTALIKLLVRTQNELAQKQISPKQAETRIIEYFNRSIPPINPQSPYNLLKAYSAVKAAQQTLEIDFGPASEEQHTESVMQTLSHATRFMIDLVNCSLTHCQSVDPINFKKAEATSDT